MSRQKYGRPRQEVERQIAEQFGEPYPFLSISQMRQAGTLPAAFIEKEKLIRELVDLGLMEDQATFLVGNYDTERIRRQLDWLSLRHAKNPISFLIAAVRDDYPAPPLASTKSSPGLPGSRSERGPQGADMEANAGN